MGYGFSATFNNLSDIWSTNEYETRILKSYFCKAGSHDHATLSTICVLLLRQSSNQIIISNKYSALIGRLLTYEYEIMTVRSDDFNRKQK